MIAFHRLILNGWAVAVNITTLQMSQKFFGSMQASKDLRQIWDALTLLFVLNRELNLLQTFGVLFRFIVKEANLRRHNL